MKRESIQGSSLVHQTENIRTDSHSRGFLAFWIKKQTDCKTKRHKKYLETTPLECTCSDNISPMYFHLFSLPSWRQCYSLCGHHFPVPVLMANFSKADSSRSKKHRPAPPGARAFTPAQLPDVMLPAEVDCIALMYLPVNASLVCTNSWHRDCIWNPNASMLPVQRGKFEIKHEILPGKQTCSISRASHLKRDHHWWEPSVSSLPRSLFVVVLEASCTSFSETI